MSQNNPASWTNNEWKFSYEIPEQESGLPGQLSPVGDRQQSPLDMLGAFGEALFSGIFDTLGNIFNGVIEVGGAIAGGLIEGIKGLVGWVGSTIASLFSGGEPRVPPPPIYSEISTDLEGDIKPFVDAFKESQEKAFQAVADAKALRELFDENQKIVSDRIDEADDKIQQVGDVDAKISAEAERILAEVEIHKAATEEALGQAETVREDLAAYKREADAKIQSALADAKAGLDELEVLEPRVSGVISDLEAYEEATNAKIQDLLGKASGAITDAGQALTQYDDLLSEYEGFKTQASGSLEALRKSSTTQGQKLGVIEDDMPGIKTSITNVFALAETAQETVDNLKIGGRNLLLDSEKERGGHRFHEILTWEDLGDYVGEQVTVSADFKGVGPGQISIYPYQSHGLTVTGTLYVALTEDWTRATWQGTVTDYGDTVENRTKGGIAVYATTSDTKIHSRRWKIERGNKATDWTPAPEDVAAEIAKAQAKADQATLDAEEKATAAREAAELYAKEKSEADAAQALVDATAEAARVAKEEADAAKAAAATDATNKVDVAQTALKTYAETQAAAAKEQAEATAALDATTKANKAKVDAEKEAKRLSDIAAAAAATAQATADQAKADAESKANAAREAAELYAKEKSEADAAQALVDAKAEAARVAQEAAAQAVLDSASDADDKVALAEAALKAYAEAQAEAAQEAAEATAALDATTKANKAKTDAEANAKKLSDAAAASAAAAQSTADQAKLDATNKAAAAQSAAQDYAKEKAEAERALAEENAAAEALRVAQQEANAAKTAAATDAKTKADEAERLAKLHADAQAALAKEQAEATAALDATTKANKAKADAEANAKILSDKAQKLAEDVKYTADTTAGKIPGMQDAITAAHGKAEEAQTNLDNLQIGGRNLVRDSEFVVDRLGSVSGSRREYHTQAITGGYDSLSDGDIVTLSFDMEVVVGTVPVRIQAYNTNTRGPLRFMDSIKNYYNVVVGETLKTRVEMQSRVVARPEEEINRDGNYLEFYTIYGTDNFFKITDLKIERGNKATDWTPAPEDTVAEIAASVQASADALDSYRTSNDKAVSDANDAAAAAAGVAQTKGEVIYQSTAPTGARATKANLWIRTSDNKPHAYNGSKWVEVTDKVAADAADKAAAALSTAQVKTTTYYGSSAPTGTKTAGDLWLDSGSDNALKRWSGSAWVVVRDGQLAKALKAAGDAQSTADGKVRSFARSTAPTGMTATDVGDIWLDTDDGNKMYRWSGTAWVTMQDHLAVQAKSVADTATTKAETAQSTVDNLQIGGRNLLLKSQPYFSKADGYEVDTYTLAVAPEAGELVTITIYGSLPEGRTGWGIYNSGTGGTSHQGYAQLISPGVYSLTFAWKSASSNTYIWIYSATSSSQAAGSPGVVRLDRVKLERGNKATDWTPAPEDVDKSIADVDYKASETGKLIPGMQDSLNIAHSKAETAQSTVDNLHIGGRNLLLDSGEGVTNTLYPTRRLYLAEGHGLKHGDRVILSAKVDVDESATSFSFHNSGGNQSLGSTSAKNIDEDGILRFSFLWKEYEISGNNTYVNFYVVHPGDRQPVTLHWVKLERGNKATDWTPAPEDVDAGIEAQANALAGYQLSNDVAVDAAKKAAQDAAGLAGGKGEVIYSTTTPPTSKRSAANLWIKGPKNTPHVWNGSAWVEITDQAAKDAAKAAADANSLAETKTTTYYQTSAPAASKSVVGDLWIDQSTAGKNALKRWSGSAWVVVQDKAIQEALTAAGTAQSTADEKVRTFSRTTAPTGMKSEHVGDLWIDTDDGNKLYRWSGSAWVGVQDAAIAAAKKAADDAASKAETAQETVDNLEIGGRNLLPDSKKERGGGRFHEILTWEDLRYYVGTKVTVSADFKGTGSGRISIYPYQSHGLTVTGQISIDLTEDWTRVSWQGTVVDYGITSSTWTKGGIAVYGTTSDTKIHSREWKIERGNKATDWTPAPEDTQADIKGLIDKADGLETGLSNAATQEDYKKLNTQLWGNQGELNKLNSLLWDDQGRLNKATEIFKSNINGWKEDVYNAFVDFDKVNKYQDGLVAANNRAITATHAATAANTRILGMVFPGNSLVPMEPGGVRTGGTDDKPEYTQMPAWLAACNRATEKQIPGIDSMLVARETAQVTRATNEEALLPADPGIEYKYGFWAYASNAQSRIYIELRDQEVRHAVLSNVADTGKGNNSATYLADNLPLKSGWNHYSGTLTLKPEVRSVRIGSIYFSHPNGGVATQILADLQVYPNMPAQSDVNKALSDVNAAQTAILTGHQRVLDMAFPNTSLVPMTDGVPVWASTVGANPVLTPEGNWRFTSGTAVQPGTGGKHVPTTNEVVYRAIARVRRTSSGSSFSVRIRKAGGATNVTRTAVTNKPALPGATRKDFITATGNISAAVNVWETWYYDFTLANNTGDVRIGYAIGSVGVEVAQFDVVALIPSQTEVDAVQDEAAESNRKAIDALERTVRLAFPHINTLPYSGGNPLWQSRASWITRSTAAANLPPASQRTETFSSLINGSGAMTRNAASSVAIPDDVSELRVRGLLRRDGGFFPIVDLHNDAGASIISAWRRTFPTDDEVSLSGRSEIWYTASSAGGYPVDGNNTDPWQPFDIVIRVKPGSNNFHIRLSSTRLLAIHGLAVFSYYPSQSEVDFAQDRAMRALSGSVDLATSIGTAAATAAENLGAAQTAMQMSLVTTASYIPRVMIINDLGHRSAHERSEHVQVRKDGSSSFLIDARGSSWTGLIVVTTFYGSSMVTDTFNITPGGDRTNGVLKRRSNSEAQHMRIDYWVNPEVETKEVVLGGTDVPHDRWSELAGTSFTATGFVPEQGVALPVLHIAELAVGWDRATHHAKYGVQIKLDGIVVATLEETRVGPRYPWGEPYAKQVVSWSGQVMPNQKITFEVLSNDTVPGQRRLRDATRLVSYSKGV